MPLHGTINAVSVTWNGTIITSPVLIYQDELFSDTTLSLTNSALVCISRDQTGVFWHLPGRDLVDISSFSNFSLSDPDDFRQFRLPAGNLSALYSTRAGIARTDAAANGLWSCRQNGMASGAVPVGIYAGGGGN